MTKISQGLKAGLAAGVIYGAMIGLLHFATLEACSPAQLQYISTELLKQVAPSNATAQDLFSTDLIYFPMFTGLTTLVFGVVCGAFFAALYLKLPGSSSKKKGMVLAIPGYVILNFLVGVTFGPAFFLYQCNPSYLPVVPALVGIPASFAFGYILGVFYDSFGRLREEQKEEDELRKRGL
ncbi:MAG: hypothetical protein ACYC7D_07980 [Nitrososphaerales archaeon]